MKHDGICHTLAAKYVQIAAEENEVARISSARGVACSPDGSTIEALGSTANGNCTASALARVAKSLRRRIPAKGDALVNAGIGPN